MPKQSRIKNFYWLWVTVLIVLADQVSKYWVIKNLHVGQPVEVTSFFNLTLAFNTGAAFGLLNNAGGWQRWLFIAIALFVSGLIIVWLYRLQAKQKLTAAGLACVLGGALGNFYDRIHYGYVIDFLDFHFRNFHFFVFNIADSAITLGAAILVIAILRKEV